MNAKSILIIVLTLNVVTGRIPMSSIFNVFDQELYESVLDDELCEEQINYMKSNATLLLLKFADAGLRIPRGIFNGDTVDLGNYYQCLGISENVGDYNIEGKYCMIEVPFDQNIKFPGKNVSPWSNFDPESLILDEETKEKYKKYADYKAKAERSFEYLDARSFPDSPLSGTEYMLAVCIPKPCTTQQAMSSLLFNLTEVGFKYEDQFCRLPNDKPFVAADYIAFVVFSLIGLFTLLSTSYDLFFIKYLKEDPKQVNKLYQSFSLYTNARRLTTFSKNPNNLSCLDGIRALSMLWIIAGHTLVTEEFIADSFSLYQWRISAESLWVFAAPISVDTFFFMSGILIVYTMVGKVTGRKLIKGLHLFYINRIVRMFPILATMVLIQASFFNWLGDGPYWLPAARNVTRCRDFWWTTLLHIQNYVNPTKICVTHSWYIAIDFQLYVISPLVLYWVLSKKKRTAWISLLCGLLVSLAAATTFNFLQNFPGGVSVINRPGEMTYYRMNYYLNTLTRAPPFFLGMVFGYLLYIWKGQKPKINYLIVLFLWSCTFVIFGFVIFSTDKITKPDWDNQTADNLINSFSRTGWSLGLGWMVFACVHGYGGVINWFLTLDMWKLPARVSYAMYLIHYPLMYFFNSTQVAPLHFSVSAILFKFIAYATVTYILSFFMTLIVDGPLSILINMALGGGFKKEVAAPRSSNTVDKDDSAVVVKSSNNNQPNTAVP